MSVCGAHASSNTKTVIFVKPQIEGCVCKVSKLNCFPVLFSYVWCSQTYPQTVVVDLTTHVLSLRLVSLKLVNDLIFQLFDA